MKSIVSVEFYLTIAGVVFSMNSFKRGVNIRKLSVWLMSGLPVFGTNERACKTESYKTAMLQRQILHIISFVVPVSVSRYLFHRLILDSEDYSYSNFPISCSRNTSSTGKPGSAFLNYVKVCHQSCQSDSKWSFSIPCQDVKTFPYSCSLL